jgi:hypothetical protein
LVIGGAPVEAQIGFDLRALPELSDAGSQHNGDASRTIEWFFSVDPGFGHFSPDETISVSLTWNCSKSLIPWNCWVAPLHD